MRGAEGSQMEDVQGGVRGCRGKRGAIVRVAKVQARVDV